MYNVHVTWDTPVSMSLRNTESSLPVLLDSSSLLNTNFYLTVNTPLLTFLIVLKSFIKHLIKGLRKSFFMAEVGSILYSGG